GDLGGADVRADLNDLRRGQKAVRVGVVNRVAADVPRAVLAVEGLGQRDRFFFEGGGDHEGLEGRARLEGVERGAVAQALGRRSFGAVGVEARLVGDREDLAGARIDDYRHAGDGLGVFDRAR